MTTGLGGHRLHLNELPFEPLPSIHAALADALAGAHRYPEFRPESLTRLVARRLGIAPGQVLIGPGATGVIAYLLQELLAGGREVVMSMPTFDGYPVLARAMGARVREVPLAPEGREDLVALRAAVGPATGVVVLCSPHNPTGTLLDPVALEGFLAAVDPRVAVLLDEAYVEFVPATDRPDVVGLIDRHPNLVVVRTFSKAYGLAGLRIGYAVGDADLVGRVTVRQVPFAMHTLSDVAARAAYDAEAELSVRIAQVTDERERLAGCLRAAGFELPESAANFVFVSHGCATRRRAISSDLEQAGIQIRRYETGTRITIGDGSATDAVLRALRG